MGHVVRIGALRTDVAVVAAPAAVAPLRARLDRVLAELLPPVLAELSGPLLDRHDGVVRIRRLRVRLDDGPLDEATLARLLAARIAAALAEALSRASENVRVWADHETYLAAYLETILGLETGPSWPFAEMAALDVLSPSEAAVEVVRTRPALLARLARTGAGRGNPARVLAMLDDVACAALLDAVLDAPPVPPAAADVAALRFEVPAAPLRLADVPRAALVTLLRTLARTPTADVPRLARAAVAAAALVALPVSWRDALTHAAVPPELAAALADEAPALPRRLRDVLLATVAAAPARAALAELFRSPGPPRRPRPADAETPAGGHRPPPARRRTPRRPLASPVGGLALLLPGAVRHARVLSGVQLRAAVLSRLGDEARRGAATDPFLAALLPADPHAQLGDVPPVPRAAVDGLPPASRPLVVAPGGVDRWGQLLLADFAGRLPGLARSSPAYLRRQFLEVPGRLDLAGDTVTVTLDALPLAVVLAMAGYRGDQGPLPHLGDRRLTIVLPGLRR
jgi:hypothetical protein